MARNDRTPGTLAPRVLEMSAVAADTQVSTAQAQELQAHRIAQRFNFSASLAAAVASLAYGREALR